MSDIYNALHRLPLADLIALRDYCEKLERSYNWTNNVDMPSPIKNLPDEVRWEKGQFWFDRTIAVEVEIDFRLKEMFGPEPHSPSVETPQEEDVDQWPDDINHNE
jgi:hypothetical protein